MRLTDVDGNYGDFTMLKAAKSSTVTPVKSVQVYTNKRTPPTILLEYIFFIYL